MLNLVHPDRQPVQSSNFTRYVGYNDKSEFTRTLSQMYRDSSADGVCFTEQIANPTQNELNSVMPFVNFNRQNFVMEEILEDLITLSNRGMIKLANISPTLNPNIAAADIYSIIKDVSARSASQSIIKNAYVKLICWLVRYSASSMKNVLYISDDISKYDVYFLYLLSRFGAKVKLVSYNDNGSYSQADPSGTFSQTISGSCHEPIAMKFSKLSPELTDKIRAMYADFTPQITQKVQNITTSAEKLPEDILESHFQRISSRGNHFTKDQLTPVYSAAMVGYNEKDIYTNVLYEMKNNLSKSDKLMIFVSNGLKNPDAETVKIFADIPRDGSLDTETMTDLLALKIEIAGRPDRTACARYAFIEEMKLMNATSPEMIFVHGVKLISWFRLCTDSDAYRMSAEIPLILFYGTITLTEIMFLHFAARCGMDTVYISPDKSVYEMLVNANKGHNMQIFELPNSMPCEPFPTKPVKAKIATVAYNAERELDTMLYGDSVFFRDYQFSKLTSMTLKTTYEEIDILWHQEAKYRSGFRADGDRVIIPNIFAKISGVPDGNVNKYWDDVRMKLSPNAIITSKAPSMKRLTNQMLAPYRPYYNGTSVDIQKLKHSPLNRYSFLSDDLQYLIFEKIQEVIDTGYLKIDPNVAVPLVIHVGMNFDRALLRLLQLYDFTKAIPKFIIIDNIEDVFSEVECTQLLLINSLGFDILIYTPTGYRDLESYIDIRAFESYTMNDFKYDLRIPKFKLPDSVPQKSGGLFGKFKKKGR